MGSHADILKVDGVNYPLAEYFNDLFKGVLLANLSNTETIVATKELTDDDYQTQIITAIGANRTVELAPEASTNHITIVCNAGGSNNVLVKDDSGSTTFATLRPGQWAMFVPILGIAWQALGRPAAAAYVLYGSTFNNAPADATTYYFGPNFGLVFTTTAQRRKVFIPRSGLITRVDLFFNFIAGSNETSSIYLRLNDTTDFLLSNAVDLSGSSLAINATGLSIPVTDTDYFEIKWVTPTWATNPTSVNITAQIFVE